MTKQRKIEIIGAVFLAVFTAACLRGWIQERRARSGAEAAVQADQQKILDAEQRIAGRDAIVAGYRRENEALSAAITTPAAAAKVIVRFLPKGDVQPIETFTREEIPAELQANLPEAPSYAIMTGSQAQDLARDALACDADRHELAACKADITDLRTEVAARTDEAKQWEAAAKAGTKWQRLARVLKLTGCAAGGAAVGALVDNTHARGSAIGAAGGVIGCSLF